MHDRHDPLELTEHADEGSLATPVADGVHHEPETGRPGSTLGRYVVLGTIGHGGMGTVLKAYDATLDRAVAIKLLHERTSERRAQQLHREAQALARLSHPNVVQVFEVAQQGEQAFIVMELVRGQTLRQWQRGEHGWREIVEVYRQAGEGLRAAHEAGLAHRDFKPDNCILDEGLRPRVLDFGLVQELGRATESASLDAAAPVAAPTRTCTVLGTPAYMALEQLDGRRTDARSDQFAFCVALYEALYGERPFAGESIAQLTMALIEQEIRPAPRGSTVPRSLRRALLRGLAKEPSERWPTMEALLTELRRIAAPPRRRLPLLVAGAGLAVLGVGLWKQADQPPPCQGAREQLAGVWDPARRREVEAAMLGTGLPYAADTWARVGPALDEHAAAWAEQHQEACEATSVRREQSAEVMDLRMECLRELRLELREAVDLLAEATPSRVERATAVVAGLREPSRCADLEALRAALPPPDDARVAAEVARQRERLTRELAYFRAGELATGLEEASRVVDEAEALGYAPLLAEALLARGRARAEHEQYAAAEPDLDRAFVLGTELGYDDVSRAAASTLVAIVGRELTEPERGLWWGELALAMSRGPGGSRGDEASVLNHIGTVLEGRGDLDAALKHFRRALELWQAEGSSNRSAALANIALVLNAKGDVEASLEHHRQAMAIHQEVLGPRHPTIASDLSNISILLQEQGRLDEALDQAQRALALRREALGEDNTVVAESLANISLILRDQGHRAEALEHAELALSIFERARGRRHPLVAMSLINVGTMRQDRGELDEALLRYREARSILEETLGPEHPHCATARFDEASALHDQGRVEEGLEAARVAIDAWRRTLGPEHLLVGQGLLDVGQMQQELGNLDEAMQTLQESQRILTLAQGPEHPMVARAMVRIGGLLVERGELEPALELYQRALSMQQAGEGPDHPHLGETLVGLAEIALRRGELDAATEHAGRAITILEASQTFPQHLARARFALARALGRRGPERARARALAEQARDGLHGSSRDEVERWLRHDALAG
ncbi:MAG: tetratricopeptide repeat protein [Myxococcales bacterium]|nr:tetratricopeptide repeat protein [Myxococcales bacterium]